MKSIEAIISSLRVAMTDARQNESHFESWMILNEAICDAIDALAEQPAQQALDKKAENARELGLDYEPAQRTWVGLVWGELPEDGHNHDFLRGAVWAEAKLKEKNT